MKVVVENEPVKEFVASRFVRVESGLLTYKDQM
jgi:hypothetical protein